MRPCELTMNLYQTLHRMLGGSISLPPMALANDETPAYHVDHDADLTGQVFVFSGFRDEVLAARIETADGRVASGTSKKVTTVLVADITASPSGKVKKANEYGIPVRTKTSFENEFYIAMSPRTTAVPDEERPAQRDGRH